MCTRYIQKPAFACQIFRDQCTFGNSDGHLRSQDRKPSTTTASLFEGTWNALEHVLVLPWNEKYTDEHIQYLATNIRNAVASLTGRTAVAAR